MILTLQFWLTILSFTSLFSRKYAPWGRSLLGEFWILGAIIVITLLEGEGTVCVWWIFVLCLFPLPSFDLFLMHFLDPGLRNNFVCDLKSRCLAKPTFSFYLFNMWSQQGTWWPGRVCLALCSAAVLSGSAGLFSFPTERMSVSSG